MYLLVHVWQSSASASDLFHASSKLTATAGKSSSSSLLSELEPVIVEGSVLYPSGVCTTEASSFWLTPFEINILSINILACKWQAVCKYLAMYSLQVQSKGHRWLSSLSKFTTTCDSGLRGGGGGFFPHLRGFWGEGLMINSSPAHFFFYSGGQLRHTNSTF